MKITTQRAAFVKAHGGLEPRKVLSYAQKVALHAGAVSAAVLNPACDVPTRDGSECQGWPIEGEQFCGPHKVTVGKALERMLVGLR
jgi:hypothetical protein